MHGSRVILKWVLVFRKLELWSYLHFTVNHPIDNIYGKIK